MIKELCNILTELGNIITELRNNITPVTKVVRRLRMCYAGVKSLHRCYAVFTELTQVLRRCYGVYFFVTQVLTEVRNDA